MLAVDSFARSQAQSKHERRHPCQYNPRPSPRNRLEGRKGGQGGLQKARTKQAWFFTLVEESIQWLHILLISFAGCSKERRGETFKNYRAEIVLLLALVIFYVTLIIFTCVSVFANISHY